MFCEMHQTATMGSTMSRALPSVKLRRDMSATLTSRPKTTERTSKYHSAVRSARRTQICSSSPRTATLIILALARSTTIPSAVSLSLFTSLPLPITGRTLQLNSAVGTVHYFVAQCRHADSQLTPPVPTRTSIARYVTTNHHGDLPGDCYHHHRGVHQ